MFLIKKITEAYRSGKLDTRILYLIFNIKILILRLNCTDFFNKIIICSNVFITYLIKPRFKDFIIKCINHIYSYFMSIYYYKINILRQRQS